MQGPTWQAAPDYSQNPRGTRPLQVPRYPPTVEQRQNGTSYDNSNNGFMFHPAQLSPDAIGQRPNGFPQNQPQYAGRTFSGQVGLSMNTGPVPSFSGTYQPSRSQPQNISFDAHRFTQDLDQNYYPNPTFSPPQQSSLSPPFLSTSPQPMLPTDPTTSGQQQMNGTSYFSQRSMSSEASPSHKRRHGEAELTDEGKDDDGDAEKSKPHGACARCKGLKVKCEFRTDTDPCRRCLNAGAVCQVPGRKKRRTPPKREHLINQIRDQATQIETLMAQLEKVHHPPGVGPIPYPGSSEQGSHSPIMSPSVHTPASSYFGQLPTTLTVSDTTAAPKHSRDIEEWISKARESLAEFGGIISAQKLVADHEDSSEDGFFTGEEEPTEEIAFAVEDADAEFEGGQKLQGSLRRMSSTGSRRSQEATSKNAEVPTVQSAIGLFANMAIHTQSNDDGAASVGVTSTTYFRRPRESPGPEGVSARDLNAAQMHAPQILKRGIVSTAQAEELFGIYFNYMNLSLSLLDPILYTPQATFWRSPFLFTTICAIASRYYKNNELYPQAMHYAQVAAAEGVISGVKNVEMASAYILLSLYPIPARRWEDDRSWLYLGLAIRVATDLNLQKPPAKPVNEAHAREMLNRTRVWLNCFNLDRSTGSQHGKTPTIRDTDYMACHSEDWWRQSPYNIPNFDIHLCSYTAELRLMSLFVGKIHSNPEHPKGFNKNIDWERLASETDDEVSKLGEKWFAITGLSEDPQSQFRTALLKLAYSYARLAILSYAFQQDVTKNKFTEENFPILMRCLRAATDVVNSYLQNVAKPSQLIFIRHGPEAQSVFITFASAFLVKLLHPKFVKHVPGEQRLKIRALVEKVVAVLGSPEVAIDDRHAPKLYSRFLQGLLDTPMATADISSPTAFQAALPRTRSRKSRGSKTGESDNVAGSSLSNVNMSPTTASFALANGIQALDQMEMRSVHAGTNHSTPEMPPLAFDNDILNSMQQFTEPTLWADYTALPGLGWMSQLQDTHMSDSFLFDNSYAPNPFTSNFQ